ncbi:hypothetical protein GCM10010967_42340 [Dyadobacter beijingensis]|uniref:Uncharacterized protein n=1 Tax=Dyadobacter beijingensis TaxID=365489 RepID=A0ABQ2I7V8_9BACT|nr:hypothetical protein GCM10010967_42340 [Dyadobacter beijingensis]
MGGAGDYDGIRILLFGDFAAALRPNARHILYHPDNRPLLACAG